MNVPASISTYITDIAETIKLFGHNGSKYPFDLAYHNNKWWVTVEVNAPNGTFEFETYDTDPNRALNKALARLRREAQIKSLIAA